jgi:hypothetical protein
MSVEQALTARPQITPRSTILIPATETLLDHDLASFSPFPRA